MIEETGLSENMENYLETIFELEKTQKVARVKDIASRLGIQRGSVTSGLKTLEEKGLVNYSPYSFITLTEQGKLIATEVARRHAVLKDFLLNVLQIDAETAEQTACRMEHAIDRHTLERLVCFVEYIHKCPRAGDDWLKAFTEYCDSQAHNPEKCRTCIDELQKS